MDFAVIISSFLSGLLSAMGFGGGTVLIIYLTTFLSLDQKQAQGMNLVFFVVTGCLSIFINKKNGLTDKRELQRALPFAAIGLAVGYLLLPIIETALLKKLFGGVLLFLGINELFSRGEKCKSKKNKASP